MKDENDVEDVEFFTCDGERETNEDGVKDDAEFENEDGCHLGGEVVRVGGVRAGVAEVVFASGRVGKVIWTAGDAGTEGVGSNFGGGGFGGVDCMAVSVVEFVVVGNGVLVCCVFGK